MVVHIEAGGCSRPVISQCPTSPSGCGSGSGAAGMPNT
eukprot:COSAG05_NODE_465_length_9537_cov_21.527086_13_plen_38_part_00